MRIRRSICVLAMTASCACVCVASDSAGSDGGVAGGGGDGIFRWTSAVSGEYFDQSRWTIMSGSGTPPPREGDRAIFNQPGPYTVTIASGGVTETDFMQLDDGNLTFRASSTTVGAVYRLTTGPADVILRGDSFILGGSSRPVNLVVGDNALLYDNVIMQVRYGSLFLTNNLQISNQASVPGFAHLELSPGTNQMPTSLTVNGQLTLGQHGIGELYAYNDSQITLGGTSFICTASSTSFSRGDMFIFDGSDVTANNSMTIGGHSNSAASGHVLVTGPGSTITQTGASNLTIGGASETNGEGLLQIEDGGALTTGTGTMLVRRSGVVEVNYDDSNATLDVNGTLAVEGGFMLVRRPSVMTLPVGTTVNVEGGGELSFTAIPIVVNGNRTLNILSGARSVWYDGGVIGDGTPGTVYVENTESSITTADPLEIGTNGAMGTLSLTDNSTGSLGPVSYLGFDPTPGSVGVMNVESGAEANVAAFHVKGMAPNTTSTLTITGFASHMSVQDNILSVGDYDAQGNGVIQLLDTGQLITSQGDQGTGVTYIWPNGLLYVDPTSRFDSDAEIIVDGGELRVDGVVNMLNDSWVDLVSGTISGNGRIQLTNTFSSLIVSHGTISPGSSAGTLSFDEIDMEMNTDSVCKIELGGLTAGTQHDQVVFDGGAAHLNGTLEVSLLPGFVPQQGDQFLIVAASEGVFDTFAKVATPVPMDVVYMDTTVRLIAKGGPPCMGDMVSSDTFAPPPDGVVDGADLAYLLGEWGAVPGGGSFADIVDSDTFQPPPDGVVDGADLAVLLGAWGACE